MNADDRRTNEKTDGPLRPAASVLLFLLLTLLLVGPLWETPGLPNSADGPLHLHRSAAVARSFDDGLYWPRWFPDVYAGLGAPTFHYYSPLFYWLTALVHSGGVALDSAAKAVLTLLFFLSGLGAWRWLRRLFGPLAGMVGAMLFLSQPHIFREFYFQGDYPQLVAILLLPLCLWAFTGLGQESRRLYWLLAPVCLALLVLAHNLTAMIGALFLALYWLALLLYQRDLPGFWRGALAAMVAAALSAFFWMPALGDVGLVQVQNLQRDFFNFRQYFLGWEELLAPIRAFDLRAANPPFPHAPGWAAWLAIGGGLVAAVATGLTQRGKEAKGQRNLTQRGRDGEAERDSEIIRANPPNPRHPRSISTQRDSAGVEVRLLLKSRTSGPSIRANPPNPRHPRSILFWGLVGSGLAVLFTVLTTQSSAFFWETLPGLDLLQFPSRFLSLVAVGAALAGGAVIESVPARYRTWAATAAAALILGLSAVFLFPRHPFLRFESITPAQTIETERSSSLWGMTSGNEFLPRWADAAAVTAGAGTDSATARLDWRSPHRAGIAPLADGQGTLVLPLHYFPGWQVRADGAPLASAPDAAGLLAVNGADVRGELELVWAGTVWQRRGEFVSLVGLLLWLALAVQRGDAGRSRDLTGAKGQRGVTQRRKGAERCPFDELRTPPEPVEGAQSNSGEIRANPPNPRSILLLLVAFILARQAIVWSGVDWFQPYSPGDRVESASVPLAVALTSSRGETLELLGWDALHREPVQPGDHLRVRLYWQPRTDVGEPLHSFLHLYSPERSFSWAIVQNQNPGRIPTTAWLPALYYVDELSLEIPPDQPPGRFALAAGLVTEEGERLTVAGSSDGLAVIGHAEIAPLRAGRDQPLQPEVRAEAQVGDGLGIQGYDLLPAPGGPILRTYWAPFAQPPPGLTLFVHLLDGAGERLAQWDGAPLEGLVPTESWQPSALYIDRRTLTLPENLASGDYSILVGLYQPQTGQRLPFTPDPGPANLFQPDALAIPFRVP